MGFDWLKSEPGAEVPDKPSHLTISVTAAQN